MPELPEVETIRQGLEQYAVGHKIKEVEVLSSKILQGDVHVIQGAKIVAIRRFGKCLVIDLDNTYCLAIHVKMTGQVVFVNDQTPEEVKIIKGTYSRLPAKSTHVIFHLDKNGKLFYNDFRRFGWIKILSQEELTNLSFLKGLGPEFPVTGIDSATGQMKLDKKGFIQIIKKTKGPIKTLLLEQKKVSGIGNIYANDALFDACIDPRRKADSLTDNEIERLFVSLGKVLQKGLESGGASELSYVNALGQEGEYQNHFLVYGKAGKPCPRDGNIIEKIMIAGRGTYFCSVCQQ